MKWSDCSDTVMEELFAFAQCYILDTDDNELLWSMPLNIWKDIHTGTMHPAFVSFSKRKGMDGKKGMDGMMTSRPLQTYIRNHPFFIYYFDFLAVDINERSRISYEILQTHDFYQRTNNKEIQSSLFCIEGPHSISGVQPIMTCDLLLIYPIDMPINNTTTGTLKEVDVLDDLRKVVLELNDLRYTYDWIVVPECSSLMPRIRNKELHIYIWVEGQSWMAIYICKRRFVIDAETGIEQIELIAALNIQADAETFLLGWQKCMQQMSFSKVKSVPLHILIPLRGDHSQLVDSGVIVKQTKQHWYLYNMACVPVDPLKSLVFM